MPALFNTSFLFASLVWGSVGVGFCVYGRKQEAMPPFLGGLVLIGLSYFVASWLWMSLLCIAVILAVCWLSKQGI